MIDNNQEFVTVCQCDVKNKSMRNQFMVIIALLGFVIMGFSISVGMSYNVERRFNVHEAVEAEKDKNVMESLERIEKGMRELKEEVKK